MSDAELAPVSSGTAIYLLNELRELERSAQAALAPGTLMQRAGTRAAQVTLQIAAEHPGPILVLAGPGNNGGDALVAAARLHREGVVVHVALLEDPGRWRGEAASAWQAWSALGAPAQRELAGLEHASVVVDGLFGIGLNRPLPANAQAWVASVNRWREERARPLLALDIPSGLSAESGAVMGVAIKATHTLSFLGAKAGLYTGAAADHVGEIIIDTLGVAAGHASGVLNGPTLFEDGFAERARDSHKGQFGSLGVLAGARGMSGAGLLCARMALYAGAGRVYLHMPDIELIAELAHPELMLRDSLEGLQLQALAAGPGLGSTPLAHELLARALLGKIPCVLDADGLNLLAAHDALRQSWIGRDSLKVITPHPLEAARLLNESAQAVQGNRVGAAQTLAASLGCVVILKGSGTIIARPDGQFAINPNGNPGLASGGTGDVLTGLIGALLAQGHDAWRAALAATWLHGDAADRLVASGVGPIGLTASELLPAIRAGLNALAAKRR